MRSQYRQVYVQVYTNAAFPPQLILLLLNAGKFTRQRQRRAVEMTHHFQGSAGPQVPSSEHSEAALPNKIKIFIKFNYSSIQQLI